MFSPTTTCPSLVIDRLVEIAPAGNGVLLLIYPTSAGGRTFATHYLGPVLDPILRSMTVVNGLSADLATGLGEIGCLGLLEDFETMRARLGALCEGLGSGSGGAAASKSPLGHYHDPEAVYELVYASKQEVMLDRKVWARDWWARQERPRVRSVTAEYLKLARPKFAGAGGGRLGLGAAAGGGSRSRLSLPDELDLSPAKLAQDVLDGVANCGVGRGERAEVGVGIEVGVFVVRRMV